MDIEPNSQLWSSTTISVEDISNEKNKMAVGRGTGLRNGQRYNRLQEKLEGVCPVNVPENR